MRFQIGDRVRLHKDHSRGATRYGNGTVIEIRDSGYIARVKIQWSVRGTSHWRERSLRLIRRLG